MFTKFRFSLVYLVGFDLFLFEQTTTDWYYCRKQVACMVDVDKLPTTLKHQELDLHLKPIVDIFYMSSFPRMGTVDRTVAFLYG